MKRYLAIAMLVLVTALATVAQAGGGTLASSPYGEWKAKMTKNELLDYGLVDPRFVGTWKLILKRDGTNRAFNGLDRWTSGSLTVSGKRLVVQKDAACDQNFPNSKGVYRWSIKQAKLKLTVVGTDRCGGRWQTLTVPLWTRA